MGIPLMDVRFAAGMAPGLGLSILGVAGLRSEAFAQYYPPGPYTPAPPAYRVAPPPPPEDDADLAPLPAPGPYGRPSDAPYPYNPQQRGPSSIQSEALPPPGGAPGAGTSPGGGALPPPGRGYSYGAWEPVRPPGDIYPPGDRGLSPGPGGRPPDYANRPMDITPVPGGPGYAAPGS